MSENRFLQLLQELLTMVDPDNLDSINKARGVISSILALAEESEKAHPYTIHLMKSAEVCFLRLVRHKDEFAGCPGDYQGNIDKQLRLRLMLQPHC